MTGGQPFRRHKIGGAPDRRPERRKQNVGRATGDPYLEGEGQRERVSGSTRQVGEQVKDAGKNVKDAFKR